MTTETTEAAPVVDAPVVTTAAASLITPDAPAAEVVPTDEPKTIEAPPVTLPGKDATPEEWAAFYGAMGRPETPEAYELPLPDGDDGAFANTMKPLLHKHGLSAEQAKGLAADWNELTAGMAAEQAKAEAAAELAQHSKNTEEAAELANEWGKSNTQNMEFAKRGIAQFVPGDAAQKTEVIAAVERVLGYKETIKFFHGIGKGLSEGGAAGLDSTAPTKVYAPGERMYGADR